MHKTPLKELFRFSRKEQAGVVLLLLLVWLTSRVPDLWVYLHGAAPPDTVGCAAALQALEAATAAAANQPLPPDVPADRVGAAVVPATLFCFDPNTLPAEGWQRLGVSARTAATIDRYRQKGGRFRSAADLERIYGLSPSLCRQLQPYVRITRTVANSRPDSIMHAERRDTAYHYSTYHRKPPPRTIDVNAADTAEWQLLPGIGPGFARRIVAFREKLGGFYDISQVSECYGLPDSTFKKIQPFLQIGNGSLKKIDLNLTDEKSLAAHPYIRYKLARLIIQYRSAHGGFRHVEELRQLPLVDDVIYRKIEHYIVITF
ncbi:helix-hairpin-helix domain-containing protein [Chitinophaga varians]|uniref:Helix-hairpin-helix domain-containing protein n=1 Tax=Chitinophaga varians TaxID=2202339 RepID=A0A847S1Q5_9BACT|nr:helix-hairpin-helix domain-containing protein [Chitinophaga varians]NLR65481.1 helix-hairpin-helix domain-containing protein [Chitinophaga varians]